MSKDEYKGEGHAAKRMYQMGQKRMTDSCYNIDMPQTAPSSVKARKPGKGSQRPPKN